RRHTAPLSPYTPLFRSQGNSVLTGLPGRTVNGVLPSLPSYSWASHAAGSFSRAWSRIKRTTACLLSILPFQLWIALSMSVSERRSEEHTSELQSRFDLV